MSVNIYDKTDKTLTPIAGKAETDIVTEWETTLSDEKVPSEKLVKDSLDSKADSSLVDGYAGEDWIFTLSTGSTVTKTVFCK